MIHQLSCPITFSLNNSQSMGCVASSEPEQGPIVANLKAFKLLIQYEQEEDEIRVQTLEREVGRRYPNSDVSTYKRQEKMGAVTVYCEKQKVWEGSGRAMAVDAVMGAIGNCKVIKQP